MARGVRAKLYGYYRSSAAYRVRSAVGLKGLDVSDEFIEQRNGKQISTDYLAINPAGRVPYWVEGDLNLAQSIAIIEYLEETYPDPPLLPRDPASRAIVREVALAVCCDIHPIGNFASTEPAADTRRRRSRPHGLVPALDRHGFQGD